MNRSGRPASWGGVVLVARREFRERFRSRAFQVATAITLVVVAAAVVVPALVDTTPKTRPVGLAGSSPVALSAAIEAQARAADVAVRIVPIGDEPTGENALRRGDIAVLVIDGRRMVWHRSVEARLAAVVRSAAAVVALRDDAARLGLTAAQTEALLSPAPLDSRTLDPEDPHRREREGAAAVTLALLLMAISLNGAMVLTGVVEEKSGRVVEVLLAHLRPWELLAGKVAGIGLLGLTQVTSIGATAVVLLAVLHPFDVPPIGIATFGLLLVWFILGYAIFSVAYGALGALAPRPEDAQNTTGPVTLCLVVAYFAAFTLAGHPDTLAAKFVSLFPLTAPLAMPERLVVGAVPWWETGLAITLTLAGVYGILRLGGRIYAGAVLRTGRTVNLVEAWRATGL